MVIVFRTIARCASSVHTLYAYHFGLKVGLSDAVTEFNNGP